MIWRKFRQDFSRLWPLVILVAALQIVVVVIDASLGLYYVKSSPDPTQHLRICLIVAWGIGAIALTVLAVQRDPVPRGGENPVSMKPGALLIAEIMFVLTAVIVPVIASDVGLALWQGRSPLEALTIGLCHGTLLLVLVCLPALAIGAITTKPWQALAVAIIVAALLFEAPRLWQHDIHRAYAIAGISWLPFAAALGVIVAGFAIIVWLRYFRRLVAVPRILFAVFVFTALGTEFIPWRTVYAVQVLLSPDPDAARAFAIAIDPAMPRSHYNLRFGPPVPYILNVPVVVRGMPAHALLRTDWLEIRILDQDGKVLATNQPYHEGRLPGIDDDKDGQDALSVSTGDKPAALIRKFQFFEVPESLFPVIKNRLVRIEVDYALTLLSEGPVARLPALKARNAATPIGRCSTRPTPDYAHQIQAFCYTTPVPPIAFFSETVSDPATGRSNQPDRISLANYAPLLLRAADAVGPGNNVATYLFHHYGPAWQTPIDWREAKNVDFVITGYVPRAHFTRKVVSPLLRLADRAPIVDSPCGSPVGDMPCRPQP